MQVNPTPWADHSKQHGIALAVCLILLLVMSLTALAGARLSALDLRLSFNDQIRIDAFEQAQSLVEAALALPANTAALQPGAVRCLNAAFTDRFDDRCNGAEPLELASGSNFSATDESINVLISALPPLVAPPPPGSGFSAARFSAVRLRVIGRYDRSSLGLGSTEIHQGVAIVRPQSDRVSTFADRGD